MLRGRARDAFSIRLRGWSRPLARLLSGFRWQDLTSTDRPRLVPHTIDAENNYCDRDRCDENNEELSH